MKNNRNVRSAQRRSGFLWAAIVAAITSSAYILHAQCPDGNNPDLPGCSTVPAYPIQPKGSAQPINSETGAQSETPNPFSSTDNQAAEKFFGADGNTERERNQSDASRRNSPLQLEPPTEFQRFVAASTGQMLPVFGSDLFNSIPTAFGPLEHGPAPGEMIVGQNDELRVRVWGQVNFSANLRVSREGEIYIPKVGAVHVAGLPFSAVSAHLQSAMERVYRNFEMSVDVGEIHSVQIYVTGLAHKPGEYTVSGLSSLVDAVFASGGPSAAGSMRHVQLKRSGKVITDFDLYALLVDGDKTGDVQLQSGDVLYIPPAGPQIAMLGSVRQAGIYELRGKESLDNLLDAAGGKTTIASGARLRVERIEEHARRRAFELTSDPAGLATQLADGDIVRVDPIISSYRETVTLRGAVANPGHYRWHEGMRLSELMPDSDSLVKRDYWWHRTQLGLPAPEFARNPSNTDPNPSPTSLPSSISLPNSNSFPNSTQNPRSRSNSDLSSDPGWEAKPASIEKLAAIESPEAQTNWNYAVIERLTPATMTTSLIPFSLGKLVLDHDTTQDLELMQGDVVTVFTQADIQIPVNEQTKYITLEGEFVHPGIYSVSADETLHSVVKRAGGLTNQAYLYAAAFTRKSTQALEQAHLNEFADQLEHELVRGSMTSIGGVESTGSLQALSINHDLIMRLRSVRASGRIVLNMTPNATGDEALPDMHLEDGDRLIVPFTPETVQVLGAVFNPHAFIFHAGAREGEYLHLAGGPNRDADRKRIFILRADGTVSSHDSESLFLGRGLNELRLHPGDSVVVPEKKLHISGLSQALSWTQALSQASMPAVEATALTH